MEGGLIKKYKFDNNDCKDWKKTGDVNPKTSRSINPESKRGIYVQLKDQCPRLLAKTIKVSKTATAKKPDSVSASVPKQMKTSSRDPGREHIHDYKTDMKPKALIAKINDLGIQKNLVIRSTILLSKDNVLSNGMSMFPVLLPKVKNHVSNHFRWSLRSKSDGTYTIRFNRLTAFHTTSLTEAVTKYIESYKKLSIRGFNMYSTSSADLTSYLLNKFLVKKSS